MKYLYYIIFFCSLINEITSFNSIQCNYLNAINKKNIKKIDKKENDISTFKNKGPIEHIYFDDLFIKSINNNVNKVYITPNNDRMILIFNDNTRKVFYDNDKKNIKKILQVLYLVGNVKIITISDVYNFFESIYSPYYSTRAI